jgi:6-phosphogluconolactonase (cycloisomerase 2 family)
LPQDHTDRRRRLRPTWIAAAASVAVALGVAATPAAAESRSRDAVYVMTNEADANRVIAYARGRDGRLTPRGTYLTGGRGTGRPRLSSQDSVVLSDDGRHLYVVNVGSDDISAFAVKRDGLKLIDREASGGRVPYSVTVSPGKTHLYALNHGGGDAANITGFRLDRDGRLSPLPDSTRPLSTPLANPSQVRYSPDGRQLVVTEKATDVLDTYAVGADGYASGPTVHRTGGELPFGGDFRDDGVFVVTEAFGARIGAGAASSYSLTGDGGLRLITRSVPNGQEETCWTVISKDGRYAYVTNFGNGTISSYAIAPDGSITLLDPVAAFTSLGQLSVRDHGLTRDGRFLYVIDVASQKVHGWKVARDGDLDPIGAFEGLPPTVAGLAAS